MHVSTFEAMRTCVNKYADPAFMARGTVEVVDVGSYDVNGSYKPLFPAPAFRYRGIDIRPGPNVDIALGEDKQYQYPLPDGCADIVISGQMLEHCEFPWSAVREMARIMKPDGFMVLIAPSTGPHHEYPIDAWRFYRGAGPALAKWAGCTCVDVWHTDEAEWHDFVAVIQHG